jgi:hypothetical protein
MMMNSMWPIERTGGCRTLSALFLPTHRVAVEFDVHESVHRETIMKVTKKM